MNQYQNAYLARIAAYESVPENMNAKQGFEWLLQTGCALFSSYGAYSSFVNRHKSNEVTTSLTTSFTVSLTTPPIQQEYNSQPPQSLEHTITSFVLPTGLNNILILSDVHIPYHNIKALQAAVQYGKSKGVDTVILNGDALDFYSVSRHEKNPNERDLKREVELGREFFGWIRGMFPKAKIYWKIGNHEDRWEKYLMDNANDIAWIEELQLSKLLKVERLGIEIIETEKIAKLGKLNLIHGHEFKGGGGGVNPARWLSLRTKATAACGHFHRTSHNIDKQLDGSIVSCWSIGALCEMNPKWLPYNDWNHGFATAEVEDNGAFVLDNKMIIDGRIY